MAKRKSQTSDTSTANGIKVKRQDGKIWSHLRSKWLEETPEERVRQQYLPVLVEEYGFALHQMDEEREVTGRGSGKARADFVIWRTAQDKADEKSPLIIVECKSDNVTITPKDYWQGDNYARLAGARFLVTHNTRESKFWRVIHTRMPKRLDEIENIPHADASNKEIEALIAKLKAFKEDEFADLLHECHNIIRNRQHLDPAAAFDEIAKVLFVKVWVERELKSKRRRKNIFSTDFLDEQLGDTPLNDLFEKTKRAFRTDRIFDPGGRINLKPATGREIVRKLERYNLSATSEDIKGIAFERFLGKTFRGEIGQFFTPRSIVEFMVRMVEPKEGDVVCDPASGSGGFLIRFFETVRDQILADADREYQTFKKVLDKKKLSPKKRAEQLRRKYDDLQKTIDMTRRTSRLGKLANECIFGTDANDRMARTSKMNMIMHGDGHGGVHHHNGFINVNGIFEGRFDIILTNPPFGANVEPSDTITTGDVAVTDEDRDRYERLYGELYEEAQARVEAAKGKPIGSMFTLAKDKNKKLRKVKTEIMFIERCLSLLNPGGRLGIVLPEGVFNNPSLAYVREYCENRAYIRAVVSLPQETFFSAGASVKASLLFMQKFTKKEQADFKAKTAKAEREVEAKYADDIEAETNRLEQKIAEAKKAKNVDDRKAAQKELKDYTARMEKVKRTEARALLKERFDYPVFLYDAEKVGISATGEPDDNELYPNDRVPEGIEKTCLELHQAFRRKPADFLVGSPSA